jgi:hypothetical protein
LVAMVGSKQGSAIFTCRQARNDLFESLMGVSLVMVAPKICRKSLPSWNSGQFWHYEETDGGGYLIS